MCFMIVFKKWVIKIFITICWNVPPKIGAKKNLDLMATSELTLIG